MKKLLFACLLLSILTAFKQKPKRTLYLVGDSTMCNYGLETDYYENRYPQMGWGQVFSEFFNSEEIRIDTRAKGGRSTRTFFQEGRWSAVYRDLKPGDYVLIQFGHNDASQEKVDRYVDTAGYKEYLRLFIQQTKEKKANPILISSVARNYPWVAGRLSNSHGLYPEAMQAVAEETQTEFIDLNQLSMDYFGKMGKDYVSTHYFMNFHAGTYAAYPNGSQDNTHFLPEGARAVAKLVYDQLKLK